MATKQDRVFPLETVALKQFNATHGTDIDKAIIHVGPYADEYTRSFQAQALAIGVDIFFRHGAYKPESEEGRKRQAHELAHVAQYKEGRVGGNNSVEELETEAAAFEKREGYVEDPSFIMVVNNKPYRIKKSEIDFVADGIADWVCNKMQERRAIKGEKEYLKLLGSYESMVEERAGNVIFDAF